MENFLSDFSRHCAHEEIEAQKRLELLTEVRDKQVKMSGFMAGVTFAITSFATVAGFLINKFWGS